MITITIHNADTRDLFVSVTDNNTRPPAAVLDNARINSGQSTAVQIQEDGSAVGNIQWTATRTDDSSVTKSGSENPSVGDQVDVGV